MRKPHARLPYSMLHKYPEFIQKHKPNLEIFVRSDNLDASSPADIANDISRMLDYGPSLTIHAPFMDLSPGAVDIAVREATKVRFMETIEVAEGVSARAVVFHSGYEKWKYAHKVEPWLGKSLEFWPDVINRASEAGVIVAIENIFEEEPGTLKMLMDGLDTEKAGICFDVGHFNLFSRLPLKAWMDVIGQYVVELHLHDNTGDTDTHLAPGDGKIDFGMLFDLLGRERDIIWTVEANSEADTLKAMEFLSQFA